MRHACKVQVPENQHGLAIAAGMPLLVLVGLSANNLIKQWQTRADMARLSAMADGVAGIGRLVTSCNASAARRRCSSAARGRR